MPEQEEVFEVVDASGKVTGTARRSELHNNPGLIHRVVHVLVFNHAGSLLLQKRSMKKDIAPGKWDTSVGGHINIGEQIHDAARREMKEELGIDHCDINHLYHYLYRGLREAELVNTFSCTCSDGFRFNTDEIDEIQYWEMAKIEATLGSGIFSPHFEAEMAHYLRYRKQQGHT
jgi:isopentenyl-diphosphate delta-isomerase type 1